jgi:hypothetical protein
MNKSKSEVEELKILATEVKEDFKDLKEFNK